MKFFAYGYVALATFNLLMGGNNAGGDAAHLGGAAAGFYFIRHSHLLTDFFDIFNNSNKPAQGSASKGRSGGSRRGKGKAPDQAEIDRILAKVSDKGLASLSDLEKKTLREASERARF
jgi:hypothetical protein